MKPPPADAAFECAGVNAVLDTMLDVVKPAGVVGTLINHNDTAVKIIVHPS